MSRSDIHQLGESEFIQMAVVAQAGWGKTVFGGTAPNALFLTTDPEGARSAYAQGSTAHEVKINDQKDLINIQLDLLEGLEHDYDWLVVDDVTTVQYIYARTSMDNRVRRQYQKGRKPGEKPGDDEKNLGRIVALVEGEGNLNRYVPEQNDRYTYQNATIDFVKWCTQLKMNVLFLYKRQSSSYSIDPEGNSDEYWTAAIEGRGGAVAEICLGMAQILGSGEIYQGKRRLWFEHHNKHRGKDRTDKLKPFRDDLDIPRMLRIINAEKSTGKEVASAGPARPRPRPRKRVS